MKILYSKIDRIADQHGIDVEELLASLRIDKNMKVLEICQYLGISKRTYLRYFPMHLKGEPRIKTQSDIDERLRYAQLAREAYSRKAAMRVKEKSQSDGYNWRKDMNKFFKGSQDERR